MQLTTLPVYSRLASRAEFPAELADKLPEGWDLSQHQLETYQASAERAADVVINTAMTGDGKSLAAYLPVLVAPQRTAFGMYPTIELSRDQQRQFEAYARHFQRRVRYDALWGARLGELAAEQQLIRRADVLKERFSNNQVILTSPDIFHLVLNYRYGSGIYADQDLPYTLAIQFSDLIFDEFHIFSMPQIVAALTAMLFLREYQPQDAPRILFSSATPERAFLTMLERAGLSVKEISGCYQTTSGVGWRHVLHQADLQLHQLGESDNAESWLAQHTALIIDHWRRASQRPRGAIILNSVAMARRVARMLADVLRPYGISVGEVTGMNDEGRRRSGMAADLVVGTSTIDVGVDFNISLLIFETLDGGSFLQRFGRLGRVRRDEAAFSSYEAHALFPGRQPWLLARLTEALKGRGVHSGDAVERPSTLRAAVSEAFPQATAFVSYARRWGSVQAAHVLATLENKERKGSFLSLAQELRAHYAKLLNCPDMRGPMGHYIHLTRPKDREKKRCQAILDEILSFRGSSPFQVAVLDTTVDPPAPIAYDALALAQTAVFEVIDGETFEAIVRQRTPEAQTEGREALRWAMKGKNDTPLVLRIIEFLPEREQLLLDWEAELRGQTQEVKVLRGCVISAPRTSPDLDLLNQVLRRQDLVCYLTTKEIADLRRELCLPPQFPLYRVVQSQFNRSYTVAFGKAALLLEAERLRKRGKDESVEPIFC